MHKTPQAAILRKRISFSTLFCFQVFDIRGSFLFKFGNEGVKKGEFKGPKGVAYSSKGYIIVADSENHRVQLFNEDGRFLRSFGSLGNQEGK